MQNVTKLSRNPWESMLSVGWVLFVVAVLAAIGSGCGPAPEAVPEGDVAALVVLENRAPRCVELSTFDDRCVRWDREVFRVTYAVREDGNGNDDAPVRHVLADGVEIAPYAETAPTALQASAPVELEGIRAPLGSMLTVYVEAWRAEGETVVKTSTATMRVDGTVRRCTFRAYNDTRPGQPDPVTANTPSVEVACEAVPAT